MVQFVMCYSQRRTVAALEFTFRDGSEASGQSSSGTLGHHFIWKKEWPGVGLYRCLGNDKWLHQLVKSMGGEESQDQRQGGLKSTIQLGIRHKNEDFVAHVGVHNKLHTSEVDKRRNKIRLTSFSHWLSISS